MQVRTSQLKRRPGTLFGIFATLTRGVLRFSITASVFANGAVLVRWLMVINHQHDVGFNHSIWWFTGGLTVLLTIVLIFFERSVSAYTGEPTPEWKEAEVVRVVR